MVGHIHDNISFELMDLGSRVLKSQNLAFEPGRVDILSPLNASPRLVLPQTINTGFMGHKWRH